MGTNVTVIIPTFNRAQLLSDALCGMLDQSCRPDRIIVVNDGSTDNTNEVLSGFTSNIEIIAQNNMGKSVALNRALNLVETSFVWLFDDDDIPFRHALEKHLQTFDKHPSIGFTFSPRIDGYMTKNGTVELQESVPLPEITGDKLLPLVLRGCFFQLQGSLIRKECFDNLGGFREDLYRSLDYEFILRLVRAYQGARIDEPTYVLRRHDGLRGTLTNRFEADKKSYHWHLSDQCIFRRLYHVLDVEEYVPYAPERYGNVKEYTGHGILIRAAIMGSKGLWGYAANDLLCLCRQGYIESLRKVDVEEAMKGIFGREQAIFDLIDSPHTLHELLRVAKHEKGRDILAVLGREMYYGLRRSYPKNGWWSFARGICCTIRLLGTKGLEDRVLQEWRKA